MQTMDQMVKVHVEDIAAMEADDIGDHLSSLHQHLGRAVVDRDNYASKLYEADLQSKSSALKIVTSIIYSERVVTLLPGRA